MKELEERIEQLERRIAEKEDELQLLKEDLEAVRATLEAIISESDEQADAVDEEEERTETEAVSESTPTEETETNEPESSLEADTEDAEEDEETPAPAPEPQAEPDHEAIMRTIEAFANKKTPSPVADDQWNEKETVGDRAASTSLNDIRKAMGLNERFLYANELFQGDMSAFTKAVEELNHLDSLADAEKMMEEELAIRFQWDEENEAVTAFKTIVSRRFA
jgi:uncharacterized coiled-coil protein SlyX